MKKTTLKKEDQFKYEWINGKVEKSSRSWIPINFSIQSNLQNLCSATNQVNQIKGCLFTYADNFYNQNYRQPDLAYYTREQILALKEDKYSVPEFVIEIISPSDKAYKVNSKLIDYRKAGVKIIWHLYPVDEEVHIYQENALKMEVKRESDICSADPVIKGFNISVTDIFKE